MGINILEIWVKFSPDQSKRVLECRFTISAIVVSATKISLWIKVRRHRTASITFEKMKKESISWRKVVWRRHSMLIKKSTLSTSQPGWNPAIVLLKFIFLFATSGWINVHASETVSLAGPSWNMISVIFRPILLARNSLAVGSPFSCFTGSLALPFLITAKFQCELTFKLTVFIRELMA